MSSPFVTVRFPDGEWELTLSEHVLKVGIPCGEAVASGLSQEPQKTETGMSS
jgi:hypothetical protein